MNELKKITKKQYIQILENSKNITNGNARSIEKVNDFVDNLSIDSTVDLDSQFRTCKARSKDLIHTKPDGSHCYESLEGAYYTYETHDWMFLVHDYKWESGNVSVKIVVGKTLEVRR